MACAGLNCVSIKMRLATHCVTFMDTSVTTQGVNFQRITSLIKYILFVFNQQFKLSEGEVGAVRDLGLPYNIRAPILESHRDVLASFGDVIRCARVCHHGESKNQPGG